MSRLKQPVYDQVGRFVRVFDQTDQSTIETTGLGQLSSWLSTSFSPVCDLIWPDFRLNWTVDWRLKRLSQTELQHFAETLYSTHVLSFTIGTGKLHCRPIDDEGYNTLEVSSSILCRTENFLLLCFALHNRIISLNCTKTNTNWMQNAHNLQSYFSLFHRQ